MQPGLGVKAGQHALFRRFLTSIQTIIGIKLITQTMSLTLNIPKTQIKITEVLKRYRTTD